MAERIEPALRAAEWTARAKGNTDPWFADDYDPRDRSPEMLARTIALANAALPDSDPRKITRERVERVRQSAEHTRLIEGLWFTVGAKAEADRRAAELIAFADAIESYLPTEGT